MVSYSLYPNLPIVLHRYIRVLEYYQLMSKLSGFIVGSSFGSTELILTQV